MYMTRRLHRIVLLLALLVGGAGMNYVQAAKVTLTVQASPSSYGQVRIGTNAWSSSTQLQTATGAKPTISAQANSGYRFTKWNDNNTNASRQITIGNSNVTYTAYFEPNTVTLTVTSNNTNYGTVTGGGTYNYGTSVTIKATPKAGYHFVQWSDGNTTASRSITATANASYQATFAINQYTIKFVNNGTTLQTLTVNHGVKPSYTGSTPTKTATAQYTYTFSGWSPTIVAATADATYTAQFSSTVRSYTIRFLNGSSVLQSSSVKYGTTPSYTGTTPTKSATAQYTYTFSGWSPTIYAVNKAQDYTAQFSSTVRSYKITGASANTAMGTVSGTATKQYNQTVTLTATPKSCYKFVQWNDGNTSNPRTVTVQGTATYTATFEETISGTCGTYVNWYFNECTGALRIVGAGAMTNYSSYSDVPWYTYRESITSVSIANTVTTLGSYVFDNYSNLTSVSLGTGITFIGNYAFCNCDKLTSITIPTSVTSIGTDAFYNCSALTSLTIPSSVTSIKAYAFYYCTGLTSITIPTSVTSMGNYVCGGCSKLTDIYVSWTTAEAMPAWNNFTNKSPQSSITLHVPCGSGDLYRAANGWKDYTMQGSGTSNYTLTVKSNNSAIGTVQIDDDAAGTTVTKSVHCEDTHTLTATGIGCHYFVQWNDGNTENPRKVGISANKTYTATFAEGLGGGTCGTNVTWYLDCNGVLTISGTGAMTNYNSANMPWDALKNDIKSVVINSGVTSIGNYAFYNCINLTSVTIPSTVTTIRPDAFENCTSLTSVTIPSSVTSIGYYAFLNSGLTDIYVSWTTAEAIPSWSSMTQASQADNITLHVPCGSAEYYLAKAGWKTYTIRGGCNTTYTLTVASNNSAYGLVQMDNGTLTASISEQVYTDDSHRITAVPVDVCHRFVQWNDGNTDNPRTVMPNTNTTYTATFTNQPYSGTCGTNLTWVLECDSTLRISGTGEMANLSSGYQPWYSIANLIKHVVIEEGVTSIGNNAFYGMDIVTVTNPSTLKTIGSTAFYRCHQLESINFPNGMTSLGSSVTGHGPFYECTSLKAIYIPASLTFINSDTFLRCYSLTSIVVDPANPKYDSRDNCNAIIETATNKLWYGCQTTVIPDGVKTVAQFAFEYQHNLKSIRISNTVTHFETSVFKECENLKDIYVEWTTTPPQDILTSWYEHSNLDATITIHVPCGYESLYSSSTVWNRYQIVDDHLKGGMCGAQGSNQTWMLSCDGHLDIKGIGAMADYSAGGAPWNEHKDAIHTVTLADGINTIGENAFAGFTNLTDINAPWTDNIPVLPASNNPQASVTLHVPCIATGAYQTADGWKDYTITPEYTASGTCGAQGDNITWTYCDGVLTISGTGEMADWFNNTANIPWYSYRESITSLVIEDGVTTIGRYAFYNCSNLTSVTIPPSITLSGNEAFCNCYAIESLYITDLAAWCSIYFNGSESNPFNIDDLFGTPSPEERTLYVNGTKVTTLTFPDGVTSIGDRAFLGVTSITDIQFNQVTTIGQHAFARCNGLTDVTIPEGVINIYFSAFHDCTQLRSMSIPATLSSTSGWSMMYNCMALTDFYVHWTENIPTWMGYTNKSPQTDITLHVPCGTEELYNAANGWNGYTIVNEMLASGTCGAEGDNLTWTLCDSTLTISGTGAMANYPALNMPWKDYRTSITSVIISEGVTTIGAYAFSGCSHLTSLTVPSSLTSVGQNAFTSCWAMESVYISDLEAWCNIDFGTYDSSPFSRNGYLIYVGGGDLYVNGTKVTTLTIPDGITEIKHHAFYGFAGITSIDFNQVTSIGNEAFNGCHGLSEVTIPEGVTAIGQYGFAYCSHLQSISIPASVSSLGTSMLAANNMLTDIHVHWTENIPAWPENFTKKNPQSSITLHIPCAAIELYQDADGWKDYTLESEGGPFTITVTTDDASMGDVSITVNP